MGEVRYCRLFFKDGNDEQPQDLGSTVKNSFLWQGEIFLYTLVVSEEPCSQINCGEMVELDKSLQSNRSKSRPASYHNHGRENNCFSRVFGF